MKHERFALTGKGLRYLASSRQDAPRAAVGGFPYPHRSLAQIDTASRRAAA